MRPFDVVERAADVTKSEVRGEGCERVAFGNCLLADIDRERASATTNSRYRNTLRFRKERTRTSGLEAGDGGVPNLLRDRVERKAVVLTSFLREAEECKEDESADDGCPAGQLDGSEGNRIRLPLEGWELADVVEVGVDICPTDPWIDTIFDVEIKSSVCGPRDAKAQLDASEAHEAEVTTRVGAVGAGEN